MKKIDKLIVAVVLILAILFGVYYYRASLKPVQKYAKIYVDNKLYKVIPLDKKTASKTIEIKNDHGSNIIQIEKGTVRILEADCPDKVCVKSGMIHEVEQSLVCFPHKLIVIIKDEGSGKTEEVSN